MTSINDNGVTTSYLYDQQGLLREKASSTARVRYEYDAKGRMVSAISSSGAKAFLTRNESDQITSIKDQLGRVISSTPGCARTAGD